MQLCLLDSRCSLQYLSTIRPDSCYSSCCRWYAYSPAKHDIVWLHDFLHFHISYWLLELKHTRIWQPTSHRPRLCLVYATCCEMTRDGFVVNGVWRKARDSLNARFHVYSSQFFLWVFSVFVWVHSLVQSTRTLLTKWTEFYSTLKLVRG